MGYFMCHFFSVWRVMSRVSRASRFQCPVYHEWGIVCVTFSVYGVSCLTYFVCHVLSVWVVMSERLVCHVFSVSCEISSMTRVQCMVCRVWSEWYVTFAVGYVSCVESVQYVTFSVSLVRYPV